MENLYVGIDVHFTACTLPKNIKGFLIKDKGQYLIYINNAVSLEEQKKAIKHEIKHLIKGHIENTERGANDLERGMDT